MPAYRRHGNLALGGGWDVNKPGAGKSNGHFDKQKDAIDRARDILEPGGGELTIHGRDEKIRDSDAVPLGRDPNPPKHKK